MKTDIDSPHMQRPWEREEVVLLVSEYFRTKHMSAEEIKASREMISQVLRNRERCLTGTVDISPTFRDYNGICMQSSRIRCIDPDTHYSGMQGTQLQKEIFAEYLYDSQKITEEANEVIQKYSVCK